VSRSYVFPRNLNGRNVRLEITDILRFADVRFKANSLFTTCSDEVLLS
jgi:hypothetical protein